MFCFTKKGRVVCQSSMVFLYRTKFYFKLVRKNFLRPIIYRLNEPFMYMKSYDYLNDLNNI